MGVGRGKQRGDATQEGEGLEAQLPGAVGARVRQLVADPAVGQPREGLESEGGAQAATAQALELPAPAGLDSPRGVQREAGNPGRQRLGRRLDSSGGTTGAAERLCGAAGQELLVRIA